MNRPDKAKAYDSASYINDLEKYCTKLEEAICYLSYKLDQSGVCNETHKCAERNMTCYSCWKEWSMQDE